MVRRVILCALVMLALGRPAAAQPVGTFQFQLVPYCDVITLAVVQQGAQYQLDGTGNQCGAGTRASVTGLAFPNANGLLGFGFTMVTAPGGTPIHVDADLNLATLNGTWRDSTGLSGQFLLVTGGGGPGFARPPSNAGDISAVTAGAGLSGGGTSGPVALAVDFAATQQRVSGACPAAQLMTGVNQDGSVVCQSVTGAGGGDITAVVAGAGLTGGASTGDAALAVSFGGPGAVSLAARSDHTHQLATGTRNVATGPLALVANGASDNVAFGNEALRLNATGFQNVAVGNFALRVGTASARNTAVGHTALEVTTGGGNTALGNFAARLNTSGFDNVAVGLNALTANTTAGFNTAIGAGAMQANTTGGDNTAVGRLALAGNTTGTENTAVGVGALGTAAAPGGATAVGYAALGGNVTGFGNSAVGQRALGATTTGAANTALGAEALAGNTSGTANTAVGSQTLGASTTANSNTAVGREAMAQTSTGSSNTAVGAMALDANTIGASNVAVGVGALGAATTAGTNTAIGLGALSEVTTGGDNIGVGFNAGLGVTTGTGNIYVGGFAAAGGESGTTRIGSGQTAAYMAGISGATSASGVQVFVNGSGKLGTATSSARFKEQIASLQDRFHARVQALRPVSFIYKPEFDDGTKQAQYGLIAEEVADVFPELVVRDAVGQVQTVRYHFLAPLLLAEVQRLERERTAAAADRTRLEERVRRLEATLSVALAALQRH